MKNSKFRAFSLLEISIVVIIIGIVIALVVQSSRLFASYKINIARNITQGSDAASLSGMVLWLETTMEKSFDSSVKNDGTAISSWYDINAAMIPSNATQSTSAYQPSYINNAINNLPALSFDGSADYMTVSNPYGYPAGAFPDTYNNFSVFIVAKATATTLINTESTSGTAGASGEKYLTFPPHGDNTYSGINSAGSGIAMGTNGIGFYEQSSSYMPPILSYSATLTLPTILLMQYNNLVPTLYVNGTSVRTSSQGSKTYVFPSFYIGGGTYGYFSGYIAEIIVYNRVLHDDERILVTKYLGKKWGIKLSSN
jgi:hypothetical protein